MVEEVVPAIAIIGLSGSGKGTVTRLVADRLGFGRIHNGVYYRCVTLYSLFEGVTEEAPLAEFARIMEVEFRGTQVFLGGVEVTEEIESQEVTDVVSKISALKSVRGAVTAQQLTLRRPPGVVVEGRDSWEIFKTPHVFYLEAPPAVRANRRFKELLRKGHRIPEIRVWVKIMERDHADQNRQHSPFRVPAGADEINTEKMSATEVADYIVRVYEETRNA